MNVVDQAARLMINYLKAYVERERIINLVKNPFEFFDLYNVAAEGNKKLDDPLLRQLKLTIEKWSSQA